MVTGSSHVLHVSPVWSHPGWGSARTERATSLRRVRPLSLARHSSYRGRLMPFHKPFQLASLLSLVFLRTQGTRDCEDTVITVDELASIPLFSTLAEKELEYGGVRSASRAAIVE